MDARVPISRLGIADTTNSNLPATSACAEHASQVANNVDVGKADRALKRQGVGDGSTHLGHRCPTTHSPRVATPL
jgi:hypothetical protein